MSKSTYLVRKIVTLAILSAIGIPLMFLSFAPIPATPWLKLDLSDLVVYIAAVMFGPLSAILVAFVKSAIHYIIKGSETGVPINQMIAFAASIAYAIPLYYTTRLVRWIIKSNSKWIKFISLSTAVMFLTLSISFTLAFWINYILVSKLALALPNNATYWFTVLLFPMLLMLIIILLGLAIKVYQIKEEVIIRVIPAMVGTVSLTVLLTFLNYIWFTPLYLKLLGWSLPDQFLKYIVINYGPFNFAKGLIISVIFIIISFRLEQLSKALNLNDDDRDSIIIEE